MAVGPNARPGAAAGFLLTSLPLGIFWFAVLAVPILLGAFLAAVWLVAMGITLALLSWTGKLQSQTLLRGLALISIPTTSLAVRGAQVERRRVAGSLGS